MAQGWSLEKAVAQFLKMSLGVTGENVPVEGKAVAGAGAQVFEDRRGTRPSRTAVLAGYCYVALMPCRGLRNYTDACESQRTSSETDRVEQLTGDLIKSRGYGECSAKASLNAQLRPVCYATIRNLIGERWGSETWDGDLDGCLSGCGLGRGPEPCKAAELPTFHRSASTSTLSCKVARELPHLLH